VSESVCDSKQNKKIPISLPLSPLTQRIPNTLNNTHTHILTSDRFQFPGNDRETDDRRKTEIASLSSFVSSAMEFRPNLSLFCVIVFLCGSAVSLADGQKRTPLPNAVTVFQANGDGYPCIRIPSLVVSRAENWPSQRKTDRDREAERDMDGSKECLREGGRGREGEGERGRRGLDASSSLLRLACSLIRLQHCAD
jgi:hypothetical protein